MVHASKAIRPGNRLECHECGRNSCIGESLQSMEQGSGYKMEGMDIRDHLCFCKRRSACRPGKTWNDIVNRCESWFQDCQQRWKGRSGRDRVLRRGILSWSLSCCIWIAEERP